MNAVIYGRVSSTDQDFLRQVNNLKDIAGKNGWTVKRTFTEKVSGMSDTNQRSEYRKLLDYIKTNEISIVMVSEVSRLGRRVINILKTVDELHQLGVAVYVQQFNMLSYENGEENHMVMLLLQMLSIGAQMEYSLRAERQRQGIELAKLNGKYKGRKVNAVATRERTLVKYSDVADLLKHSDLSVRKISGITGRSINTVRRIKSLL